jgi:hypothetical protein
MVQWAWEFLRRRTDYREQWQKEVQPLIKGDGEWDAETDRRSCEADPIRYVSPLSSFGRKFKVRPDKGNEYLAPHLGCPPGFDHLAAEISGGVSSTAWVKLPLVVIQFDVRSPRDPQFVFAKQKFDEGVRSQKRKRNLHVQKFQTYLRLLDFKEIGAPANEIGNNLFPRKFDGDLRDMISKNLKYAHGWQKDYLSIAFGSRPNS